MKKRSRREKKRERIEARRDRLYLARFPGIHDHHLWCVRIERKADETAALTDASE